MSSEVFGHSIYRGTPPSSVREERDTEREREREREKGRVRVWGRLSGPEVLVFVPSPTFA